MGLISCEDFHSSFLRVFEKEGRLGLLKGIKGKAVRATARIHESVSTGKKACIIENQTIPLLGPRNVVLYSVIAVDQPVPSVGAPPAISQ